MGIYRRSNKRRCYIEYYVRIRQNPLALKVKLADIKHNLEENRLNKLPYDVKMRLRKKYNRALEYLNGL